MDRRLFLKSLIGAGATSSTLLQFPHALAAFEVQETMYLMSHGDPNSLSNDEDRFKISNIPSGEIITLQGKKIQQVKIPFFSHDVVANPLNKDLVFALGRWGQKAALVSLSGAQAMKIITYEGTNRRFNGHASFFADGKSIIASESSEDLLGTLVIRSSSDLKILDSIPTYGYFPHQFHINKDHSLISVVNTGFDTQKYKGLKRPGYITESCLNIIDMKTKKLIHSIKPPKRTFLGHMFQDSENNITIIGTNNDYSQAYIGFVDKNLNLKHPVDLSRLRDKSGEHLSVIHHEGFGFAIVTNRRSNTLSVWDYKKAVLIRSFELRSPCGVALYDARTAIINYNRGEDKKLIALSLDNLNLIFSPWDKIKCGLGSHINRA